MLPGKTKSSNADDYIKQLPLGYDTPLMRYFESEGIELSIGQWQKLSIARAFYSDSDILILDEPTASLDAIAEQQVFNRFSELSKDKITVFVVVFDFFHCKHFNDLLNFNIDKFRLA